MLIVSDDLPEELVRVIEFLNGQMNPAEILGVEVPQYLWGEGGVQILVPNIVGATRQAVDLKQLGTVWSRESFQEEAGHRSGAPVAAAFDRLFGHVESHGGRLSWSEGVTPGVAGWLPIKP
jgi:hypothetical protein